VVGADGAVLKLKATKHSGAAALQTHTVTQLIDQGQRRLNIRLDPRARRSSSSTFGTIPARLPSTEQRETRRSNGKPEPSYRDNPEDAPESYSNTGRDAAGSFLESRDPLRFPLGSLRSAWG